MGSVIDSAGKPVKGATVTASNREAYPPQRTTTTDDKGRFAMIGLRSGLWTMVAEAPGFQRIEGAVPIRSATNGPPVRFVLSPAPEVIPGSLTKDIDDQIRSAQALRDQGQYAQAISAFESIRAKNPKLTSLNLVLGTVYREQAQRTQDSPTKAALYGHAMAAYTEMVKTDPGNARVRLELGMTQMDAGQVAAGTRTLQALIDELPQTPAAREALARMQETR